MFNLEGTPFHLSEAATIMRMTEDEIQLMLGGGKFPQSVISFYRPRAGFNFSNLYDIFSVVASNLTFDDGDRENVEDEILKFIDQLEFNISYFEKIGTVLAEGIIGEVSEKIKVDPLCKSMRNYARLGEYYSNYSNYSEISWEVSHREEIYACILVLLLHRAIPIFLSDDFGVQLPKSITIATSNIALVDNKALPYFPLSEMLFEVSCETEPKARIGKKLMRN